ncbi:MAG: DUF4190 domain-containing protein [Lachnospiraceae bacterium]|nr:DUF4190 domain-containing protein [Lachnospiraceae bacterium]
MEENYYAAGEKKESKALEICSLVFGILSIVCCCCYGIFGIVGLVLSIVALATGKKSGLSIAGLICSIVGIVFTIILLWIGFNSPEYQQMMQSYMQTIQ